MKRLTLAALAAVMLAPAHAIPPPPESPYAHCQQYQERNTPEYKKSVAEAGDLLGDLSSGVSPDDNNVGYVIKLAQLKNPEVAAAKCIEGEGTVIMRLSDEGQVLDARYTGDMLFAKEAIKAVYQSKFASGKPGWHSYPVFFRLDDAYPVADE